MTFIEILTLGVEFVLAMIRLGFALILVWLFGLFAWACWRSLRGRYFDWR